MFLRCAIPTLVAMTFCAGADVARAQGVPEVVNAIYDRYFGRPADPGGVEIWIRELRRGADPLVLEGNFLANGEYYQRVGGTPGDFIVALYHDVAGVDRPSRKDVDRWARHLERLGGDTNARARVALDFLRETGGGIVQSRLGRRTFSPAARPENRPPPRPYDR
jgi:hypothetical protein